MPVWLVRLRLRARALFDRDHDRKLRDELQLHIDLLADEFASQGMTRADAVARAHREFGNVASLQETSHGLFSLCGVESVIKDVTYATREIRRSPAFTAVAVLSLAVGIGVATATFSVVDAVMLHGLPVPRPDRLVAISSASSSTWSRWNYATFRQWADAPDAPFSTAAIHDISEMERPAIAGIPGARVSLVSGNYFEVLGVTLAAGRVPFPSDDHAAGSLQVAVVSYAFMERQFGSLDETIGRRLQLNGTFYEIVGVTSRAFTGDWIGQPTDIWLPLSQHAVVTKSPADLLSAASPARWLRVIARLKGDIPAEQASAAANLLFDQLTSSQQSGSRTNGPSAEIVLLSAERGYAPLRQRYAQPLMIIGAISLLVLVIACANFTNLLYARSRSRQQEFAVRLALGAGTGRIARQSLTECIMLASLAGVLGLAVSSWVTNAALARFAAMIQPVTLNAGLDARVLAFAASAVGLVVLFGVVPCLASARLTALQRIAQAAMRERRGDYVRRGFLIAQVALCALLLVVAGLMVRTVQNLRTQDLGFDRNLLLLTIAPRQAGYGGESAMRLLADIRERLLAIRGITDVSATSAPLLDARGYWVDSSERLTVDGSPAVPGVRWTSANVTAGFFGTIGTPIVQGRELRAGDFYPPANAVVINQSMSQLLFGAGNPIGRRISAAAGSRAVLVVGVVNDALQTSPRDRGLAVIYRPLLQSPPQVVLAIRTAGPASAAVDVVHHQLQSLDGTVPIVNVQTVDQVLDAAIGQERLIGTFAVWLGVLVMIVVCVGVHALVANDVAERFHEIGVRIAFGATRAQVAFAVLRDSATLVLIALCVGIPLSLAAIRPLTSQLYGLRPDDPQTLAVVTALLMVVALGAAYRPARAATRVDPVILLRAD